MKKSRVFVDGALIGLVEDPRELVGNLRKMRRKGEIPTEINVSFKAYNGDVIIHTDRGRARRPLIVLEKGKPLITPEDIERLGGTPREARKIAAEYRFFIAETSVMSQVGRYLGPRLGPRGRMPIPVQPGTDIRPMVDRLRGSAKIRTKDRTTFHARVGSTEMDPDLIAENIDAVMKRIEGKLEQGHLNIRSVYVKTTMGPAVRLV